MTDQHDMVTADLWTRNGLREARVRAGDPIFLHPARAYPVEDGPGRTALWRVFRVAKGEEGGQRCGLFALGAITFGGAMLVASLLAIVLSLGPGR